MQTLFIFKSILKMIVQSEGVAATSKLSYMLHITSSVTVPNCIKFLSLRQFLKGVGLKEPPPMKGSSKKARRD